MKKLIRSVSAALVIAACNTDDGSPDVTPRDGGLDAARDADVAGDAGDIGVPDAGDALDTGATASVTLEVSRGQGRSIEIVVRGESSDDVSLRTSPAFGALSELSPAQVDGSRRATLTPPAGVASSFTIEAIAKGEVIARRPTLSFAQIGDRWGVPEPVPGMVNTPGWEDSAEISPDGEWLIVGTYSPVDLGACSLAGQRADRPECETSIGPYEAPKRPDMPGRDRILSPTDIVHNAPSVGLGQSGEDFCFDPGGGPICVAIPPIAAYGFRHVGGEFVDPFPIAYQMDGNFVAPFGFTFMPDFEGRKRLLFSFDEPTDNGDPDDTKNDIHVATGLLFGAPVDLGSYSFEGGSVVGSMIKTTPLDVSHVAGKGRSALQGNPAWSDEGIWFDTEGNLDENGDEEELDLWFAPVAGEPPAQSAIGPGIRVGVSEPGRKEFQPYVYGDRLYYATDFNQIRSNQWVDRSGVGPASFADPSVELDIVTGPALNGTPGELLSVGEPSLALDEDETLWLYFVYAERVGSTDAFNQNIGRVRARVE